MGDFLGGLAAGFGVGGEHVVDGGELNARRAGEDALDDFGDAEVGQAMIEKRGDGDFVGCVEGAGQGAAFFERFTGETQTGETTRGSFGEVEAAEFGPVQMDLIRLEAGGIGERVLDGHAHVRRSELREDGAIDEFDEGVDGGLWMNDDVDLIRAHVEEPVGFDDFETFVHHRGGVDGDAIAHAPVGMIEGLLDGDAGEFGERRFAEGATGSGEDEAADFGIERSVTCDP